MSSPFPVQALRHRNFRLIWLGQLVSFSGSNMQNAAILWHVSLLAPPDQKGLALGLVGLVKVVPIIVFSLISGVAADALNRRKLMFVTQIILALLTGVLALLTFRGITVLWPIYLLAALSAAASSFDAPARQSLIPNLVPAADFPNAISLNTIMFQFAAVAGPMMSGVVIAGFGIGWAYALNALSFLAVIAALVMMRDVPDRHDRNPKDITIAAGLDGLRFVFRNPLIRSTMLLDFFATLFASAMALLPIFAQDVLKVDAHGYGILYAAPAVGAAITGLVMVRAVDWIDRRGRAMLISIALYGLATVIFGFSRSFWLTAACLALIGAADTVSTVLRNIIRQLRTPDRLRGRMTSINMIFFMGGPQLGELEAGLVAQMFSAPISVISGGVACLMMTGWVAARTPALRNYRRQDDLDGEELKA